VRPAIFVLLFVSYGYFYQAGGWNQNTRFNLVRAILNDGSLQIDPYHLNTGDKAFHDGHYYADKAPGLSFAALPIVWPVRFALGLAGGDGETFEGLALLSYVATVFTVGLVTAWSGVVLYDLALWWGASRGGALVAVLAYGLGSPIWSLATLFIGHAIAAACLILGLGIRPGSDPGLTRVRPGSDPQWRSTQGWWPGFLIGVAAGWATISEFPAAVPAAALALWTAYRVWPLGRGPLFKTLGGVTAGALLCAGVLMAYQWACFGSPFHVAYSSEEGFEGMRTGFFGIALPDVSVLQEILVGEFRGLLPLAPIFALAPWGLALARRDRDVAWLSAFIIVFYLALNAGYHYWEGGWSFGPRHLAPALPFACLGLALLWTRAPAWGRALLALLCAWGIATSLIAVSTMAQPPASLSRPMTELLWPHFREGNLSLNTQTFATGGADPSSWGTDAEPRAAWNLGMKMGLEGHASLIPLAFVWVGCGVWMWQARHKSGHHRPAASNV
jgi:hypothetical protein